MNELALFAGAGGGILGGHLLGWRTVCAVEWEPYPASVLCARQNEGVLPPFPIWDDVQTFDGRPWRGRVDVVSGGFPCQDISAAGKGAGIDGQRSGMWGHMARIIREVEPRFVFVENSPMLTSRGLGRVLGDLAAMGYDARWGVLGAVHAGAPHKRDRIWIVADAEMSDDAASKSPIRFTERASWKLGGGGGSEVVADTDSQRGCSRNPRRENAMDADPRCQDGMHEARAISSNWWAADPADVANTDCDGRRRLRQQVGDPKKPRQGRKDTTPDGYARDARDARDAEGTAQPDMGRVAHGVAARVDRLKAIGNGQVPAVAALAWQILSKDFTQYPKHTQETPNLGALNA